VLDRPPLTVLVGLVTGIIDSILGTDYDDTTGGLVNSIGSLALLAPPPPPPAPYGSGS
jgi:hypothetical protein